MCFCVTRIPTLFFGGGELGDGRQRKQYQLLEEENETLRRRLEESQSRLESDMVRRVAGRVVSLVGGSVACSSSGFEILCHNSFVSSCLCGHSAVSATCVFPTE